jgi:two-component system, NtrC family, nitrogen regulation sensor histidine kinase NtrY
MAAVIESDLARESGTVGRRLRALAFQLPQDNRFRLGLQGDPAYRGYLLDYAGQAMRLSGLALLQIQDSTGRILSSGHFRNEYDRLQPELPRLLANTPDTLVLVRARTPESSVLAMARVDSFRLGRGVFTVLGGLDAERRLAGGLARDSSLQVTLIYPGAQAGSALARQVVREVRLPYLDLVSGATPVVDSARLVVTQSLGALESLRSSLNRWVLAALSLTLVLALGVAAWLSARISRPLRDLAEKTSLIDLDRLDQSFETDRNDEVGSLSRLLAAMTDRLRTSSARLREVERRAAVGDLARQVNHDIKNGLTPIRNVLRHLTQVGQQNPETLAEVFAARKATLESSVEYLDTLARNYDRLAPGPQRQACDVNALVEQVVQRTGHDGVRVEARLWPELPPALGDALMVRRILENLVGNAQDSVAARKDGTVTVSTERVQAADGSSRVRVTVADTGSGMTEAELNRAFDDFYTTKPGGSGLGLSIVRRLILDLDGTLRVETEPSTGTRVLVDLPSAGDEGSRS